MKNFWAQLPQPFLVLAPMDDVTDVVFRQIIAQAAAPDVYFTEFTNADGYCSAGRETVMKKLQRAPQETNLIAQIWGLKPENYKTIARDLAAMGFAGIDINMGCPQKKELKMGACAALIKNPALAKEIIAATKEGAGQLPVSVKTRLGFSAIETNEWIGFLLEQNLAALTVHTRTVKEMSKVPAHTEAIGQVVALRNKISPTTKIIVNGDIENRAQALEIINKYGCDGAMIGRGIFHNIFAFENDPKDHPFAEMFSFLEKHLSLFEQTWGATKDFNILKRFFKIYISGFDGAAALRAEFMQTKNYNEAHALITKSHTQLPVV